MCKERNMKRKVKRFFIFTVRGFTCMRLLIFAFFCWCLCCSGYFKVCCINVPRLPIFSASFLCFFSHRTSTSSCLTHLFIFSRNWIIYLRETEGRKWWQQKPSTTTKITETFTPSLNLNTVKALTLLSILFWLVIEGLETTLASSHKKSCYFLWNGN